MNAQQRSSTRSRKVITAVIAVIVGIALLLGCAEWGARYYFKKELAAAAPGATAEFGSSPLLLGIANQENLDFTLTVPNSLDIQYNGENKYVPSSITGNPPATIRVHGLKTEGDTSVVQHVTVDSQLPQDFLLATVQQNFRQAVGDNPVAQFVNVTGLEARSTGELVLSLVEGVVAIHLRPVVRDGQLSFESTNLQIAGIPAGQTVVTLVNQALNAGVNEQIPSMRIDEARVEEGHMTVNLSGDNVNLDQIAELSAKAESAQRK